MFAEFRPLFLLLQQNKNENRSRILRQSLLLTLRHNYRQDLIEECVNIHVRAYIHHDFCSVCVSAKIQFLTFIFVQLTSFMR